MENFTDVKLEIFAPQEYALKIRNELAKIGVGRIGNYDHCLAISPGWDITDPCQEPIRLRDKSKRSAKSRNIRLKSIAGASW
jgi:hypothetical protein